MAFIDIDEIYYNCKNNGVEVDYADGVSQRHHLQFNETLDMLKDHNDYVVIADNELAIRSRVLDSITVVDIFTDHGFVNIDICVNRKKHVGLCLCDIVDISEHSITFSKSIPHSSRRSVGLNDSRQKILLLRYFHSKI